MAESNLKILDCTLRDGGYLNSWIFGRLKIQSIVSRLDGSGIDIIEVGFLKQSAEYDENCTLFPTIASIAKTLGGCIPKKSDLVAMIEFGNFDADNLIPKNESVLSGIRLIFSKYEIDEALVLARKIKEMGYKLYVNPVALFSYTDSEILSLIEKINIIDPVCVSIVDTYGTMFWQDLMHYVDLLNHNLNKNIDLGFHSHNNLGLSNANTIEFIRLSMTRGKVADASILGMGRRAGNACTEVVCSYLEKFNIKDVSIDQILETAYSEIAIFRGKQKWGYDLDNLIAAIFECSASWVQYYLEKNTLTITSIRSIISALPKYDRSLNNYFSKALAEEKYLEYLQNETDDSLCYAQLADELRNRKILLVCPGKTISKHKEEITSFIENNNPVVITVNFCSEDFKADYCFVSNPKRVSQVIIKYKELETKPLLLTTSNVLLTNELCADKNFNYKTLHDEIGGDNSCIFLLRILKKISGISVTVAGFDGYNMSDAYVDTSLEWFQPTKDDDIVNTLLGHLEKTDGAIKLKTLTPSEYDLSKI